ncbi:MAG: DUF2235 domain-containing protein [Rubrivivax sp.]|jgi:uncharacterized protein (DUF2235 family)|nr:DUF2235 domain-containing protein [Rubrivivax sp.]
MKRIVICADGTWNERDRFDPKTGTRRPTNVTKTARAVCTHDGAGVSQLTYYHPGVGTGGPLDQLTGGAFGAGMEHNIREMYRFIVYNHTPGDELYFFGFSRGAFTVRSLAGFIHFAGLVSKDEDYYVPDLFHCYASGAGPGSAAWNHLFVEPNRQGWPRLKDRRAQTPPIRFIGVWDTVGALGPPGVLGQVANWFNPARHSYHAVGLSPLIQHAAHALAIDENRVSFKPTLFDATGWPGQLHQAWFAGVHTDIGGGYDYDDHANHALNWVLDHAKALGLVLDERYLGAFSRSRLEVPLHDSRQGVYRLLPCHWRPIGEEPGAQEQVHPSALQRQQALADYRPTNLMQWLERQPG